MDSDHSGRGQNTSLSKSPSLGHLALSSPRICSSAGVPRPTCPVTMHTHLVSQVDDEKKSMLENAQDLVESLDPKAGLVLQGARQRGFFFDETRLGRWTPTQSELSEAPW